MSRAFIFPGQGSQFIGMGKDLADAFVEAREVFQEVDDALSQNLTKIMFEGPEGDLNLTENTQPALMAVSLAVAKILKKQGGVVFENSCAFMAGHSLGEYSALTAAGSLEIGSTAKLLKRRGQAMQKAVPVGVGAMAAILGLDLPDVLEVAKKASNEGGREVVCQAANDNSQGQVVVSGHAGAVQLAIDYATQAGAKRALLLPVSAPFHCSLMAPAAQEMAYALADTVIRPPCVPVVSNVTAKGVSEPSDIRRLLVDQITGMVRWRESVQWMKEQGVTEMVELGAGKVLAGLVKRIDKDIACESVGTPEGIEALIAKLKI
ncbi:MAG: [acyl-carrier-protein] S-malonyltransferase [Micavibrio aeruginosavorus]|uniref:Malonyl CoA-acyl carrier protein transacylase n=1 Tax=Micavibrio aeruginosavorus TaxID=349221 RepID=A0A2W5C3F5_9BACT|nr:MAG: [acyl-carrier-protein] S-malonyltransferase [Micavibrio aeruginosavorus]